MKKKLLTGIVMATLSMSLLVGCGEKEQHFEDVAPPKNMEESMEPALEVETEASNTEENVEEITEISNENETEAEVMTDNDADITEETDDASNEDADVENENVEIEVNEVVLIFDGDAETVTMEGGSTAVFTLYDEEMNMSRANVSVFDAADYADQIQMVKEKNHEHTDAYGHTYWTATHTEENAVFAAYEGEKFIVISWEGDEGILEKIEHHLNWPY